MQDYDTIGDNPEGPVLSPQYPAHCQVAGGSGKDIKPDWLLIWKQYDDVLELLMLNTGTHSDLFKK